MPNINVSIPHQLSKADAKLRIEELIGQLQQQYGGMMGRVEKSWSGDTLTFTVGASGMSVSGHVYVEDQLVRVEVAVPWALAMFAGTLKKQIEDDGRRLLGPPPSA
jgi:putative polyhydroxyalkanoate system protein